MLASIELTGIGGDVVYLLITVAFFGLARLLVKACERIIGPELAVATPAETDGLAGADGAGSRQTSTSAAPVGTRERVAS